MLFLNAHLVSTAFLAGVLGLTDVFFGNFSDWFVGSILLHALWNSITLIVFNVSVFNIDDTVHNLMVTIGFT